MHQLFLNFKSQLKKDYSSLPAEVLDRVSPNLVSAFTLQLPREVLEQARHLARELEALSQSPFYQKKIQADFPFTEFQRIPSLLTSIDAHVTSEGELRIIEVNTNASSYLIHLANYEARQLATFPGARASLLRAFRQTFGEHFQNGSQFLIVDEKPEQQHLYFEFLMYLELFQKELGIQGAIADPNELALTADGIHYREKKIDSIYNRYTDFYLSKPESLKTAYQHTQTLISPHPWGYALLADKRRFLLWDSAFFSSLEAQEGLALPHLQKALLKTRRFRDFASADELWAQRARYFFKPPNAYGGKSVYRGKTISRTVFQRIFNEDYLAQESAPAPTAKLSYNNETHEFKYDLRFYVFNGEVQLAGARLYQGQLTNLKTPLGGATPLVFV